MRINKVGVILLGMSIAILVIGGVFFGMAAVSHTAMTTSAHTATQTATYTWGG